MTGMAIRHYANSVRRHGIRKELTLKYTRAMLSLMMKSRRIKTGARS